MNKSILLILLITSMAIAQTRKYDRDDTRYGFGVQVSYFNSAEADAGGVMFGVLARAKFARVIGAELSVNYRSEDYGDDFVSVSSVPILLSVLIYPADFLYGVAGVGLYNTTFDYSDGIHVDLGDESSSEFGYHLGAGLTLPLAENFRIFGDLRYHFLNYDLRRLDDQILTDYEVDANFYTINIGALLMF